MKIKLIIIMFLFSSILLGEYQFKGRHFIASYYDCDKNALDDCSQIEEVMREACLASGASVIDDLSFSFDPCGVTMVVLLSESHASIHTYPEYGACFVDLFTCGDQCLATKFSLILEEFLKPKQKNLKILERE